MNKIIRDAIEKKIYNKKDPKQKQITIKIMKTKFDIKINLNVEG